MSHMHRATTVPRRVAALLLVGALGTSGAAAQAAIDGPMTLERVIATALSASPSIRLSLWRADIARGAVIAAGAPFDNVLATDASMVQDHQLSLTKPDDVGSVGTSILGTSSNHYSAGVSRRLRSGFVLTPQVGLVQRRVAGTPLAASSSATLGLGVAIPLLRDRLGRVVRAGERAAEVSFTAESLEVSFTRAQTVYAVVVAYWRYVGAAATRAALEDAEARARQHVRETEVLIAADERAPADLKQVTANLATRRVASLAARQTQLEAWRQVVVTAGFPATDAILAPPPATDLPPLPAADDSLSGAALAALVRDGLQQRSDVAAAQRRRMAASIDAEAAAGTLRPRLDLVSTIGYAGLAPGGNRLLDPFGAQSARPNLSLGIQYQLPTRNLAARGTALQAEGVLRQSEIAERDIARQVEASVLVTAQGVTTRRAALREATLAVSLSRDALDNEMQRFRLASSTIFEVLQSQDALTNALLNEVNARVAYATAIADVRFAAGGFGASGRNAAERDAATAVTPP
ncbi:MAG: TolC family protein [Gemmatimonadaceae bacterium]|nr:TolC family protein [Gemmatimonadaceae bacterium]